MHGPSVERAAAVRQFELSRRRAEYESVVDSAGAVGVPRAETLAKPELGGLLVLRMTDVVNRPNQGATATEGTPWGESVRLAMRCLGPKAIARRLGANSWQSLLPIPFPLMRQVILAPGNESHQLHPL